MQCISTVLDFQVVLKVRKMLSISDQIIKAIFMPHTKSVTTVDLGKFFMLWQTSNVYFACTDHEKIKMLLVEQI